MALVMALPTIGKLKRDPRGLGYVEDLAELLDLAVGALEDQVERDLPGDVAERQVHAVFDPRLGDDVAPDLTADRGQGLIEADVVEVDPDPRGGPWRPRAPRLGPSAGRRRLSRASLLWRRPGRAGLLRRGAGRPQLCGGSLATAEEQHDQGPPVATHGVTSRRLYGTQRAVRNWRGR